MPTLSPQGSRSASSSRSSLRWFLSRRALAAAVALAAPMAGQPLRAIEPDQALPDVENSRNSVFGLVNSNAAYVRSGPGDNYYATAKAEKGAKVKVVGMKFDWLKIVPPDGSFCYVSRAYVEKRGDGSVGRVTKDAVNVRAGSSLNKMKIVPLCQLAANTDVTILGEEDEYLKIKPPAQAYLYINKSFVDRDPTAVPEPQRPAARPARPERPATVAEGTPRAAERQADSQTERQAEHRAEAAPSNPTPANTTPDPSAYAKENGAKSDRPDAPADAIPSAGQGGSFEAPAPTTPGPTTDNAAQAGEAVAGQPPATAPAPAADTAASIETLFEVSEADFTAASSKPLAQQPLAELVKSYTKLAASDRLLPSMRQVAEGRLKTLQIRQQAAEQYADLRKSQEELKRREQAIRAEREELEVRMAANTIQVFTAVGTLQPSSLQHGSVAMYRLTDPANGRTVCYVRTADSKYVGLLNRFVGLKGELTTDPQMSLRVLMATDAAVIDPLKVNNGISAQVVPPSLRPGAQASTLTP